MQQSSYLLIGSPLILFRSIDPVSADVLVGAELHSPPPICPITFYILHFFPYPSARTSSVSADVLVRAESTVGADLSLGL
jgi:hypothetical protein